MNFDSAKFLNFISLDVNRKDFIIQFLNDFGIQTATLKINSKNHIYVKFKPFQYNSMFKLKTIIAHYDRVDGVFGANDNSFAVFCLMNWAKQLNELNDFHNIRLIFTDGEENAKSLKKQGAYDLAQHFKNSKLTDEVYVFDCMGRGEVPILCQTNIKKSLPQNFVNRLKQLEDNTKKILKSSANGLFFELPTNYSDNAGFLVNLIPAVTISMLPSNEVNDVLLGKTPKTWQIIHTKNDDFKSLTPNSLIIFEKILNQFARLKTLNNSLN